MKWFKNLRMKSKMLISFLLVVIMMIALAVFSIIELRYVEEAFTYTLKHPVAAKAEMQDFRGAARDLRRIVATIIMYAPTNDTARMEELFEKDAAAAYKEGMAVLDGFEAIVKSDERLPKDDLNTLLVDLKELRDVFQLYKSDFCDKAYAEAHEGNYTGAMEIVISGTTITDSLRDASDVLIRMTDEVAKTETAYAEASSAKTVRTLIIVSVPIALIAVIIALYMASLVSKPMSFLASVMVKLAKTGNFIMDSDTDEKITNYRTMHDELGQMADSFASVIEMMQRKLKTLEDVSGGDLTTFVVQRSEQDSYGNAMRMMVDRLTEMFREIHVSADHVTSGSNQIANGSQALAQGSTEQASSVQELSASISEIARKTKDNAELAGRAAVLANTIKQNAETGSRQMDEMMTAVKDINLASQSINKVIKVIDDIAFQTNILALNAAVEAARAGQHGKGFAVVAEEVRNLAAKSAEAAKDTGGLIANSMEKAELGSRIATDTAASLAEIVSGINESSLIVSEIAQSSEQQSTGITQINHGIDQVANVVQQNSATAQESAAASEEMSGEASMLQNLLSQFKLADGGAHKGLPAAKQKAMPAPTVHAADEDGPNDKY